MPQLFRKILVRLKAHRGESLVETLAAILVSALAIVMLSTGVATATRLNVNAHESEDSIRTSMKAAEVAGSSEVVASNQQIRVTPDGGTSQTYNVVVYGSADDGSASEVVAYAVKD